MEKEIFNDEKKLEPVSGGKQVNIGMSTVEAKCPKCGSERIEVQGEQRVKEPFKPGYFISRWICSDCNAVFTVKDDGAVEYEFTLGGVDDPR